MTSTAELVRRAEIVVGDLSSNGGLLLPEQSNQFIDYIVDEPTLLKQVRTVRMNGPTRRIERVGFDSRVLRKAVQTIGSRALVEADRSKPTTSKIELQTKEVIGEVRIPYEVLEDNIEREGFQTHVIRLMAGRVAQDLEELALLGDTAGSGYLSTADGFLKQMTSHVVNNLSAGISAEMFDAGLLAMPQRYLRNIASMKHFISEANRIKYRQRISQRVGGLGDAALTQNIQLSAGGVQIEAAPMLAAAGETGFGLGDGAAKNQGITTFPQNLIFGVQRDIRIESDKSITDREFIIVVTARVDFKIDDEKACVKYINI